MNEPVVGESEQGGMGDCGSTLSGSTRAHILSAMVDLVVTEGYAAVTVERLSARAAVSPDDFERSFPDLESCFLAAFDVGVEEAIRRVTAATFHADALDPMRSLELALERGLRALLECVSDAPALARLCLVEVATVGARGLARREATLARFARLIEIHLAVLSHRPPPLASEMVVGGVHEILERRVRRGETGRLAELAPALTQVWLPVLRGGAAVP